LPLPQGHSAFLPTFACAWESIWRHYRAQAGKTVAAPVEEWFEITGALHSSRP